MRNSTILLLALILFFGGTAIYSSFEFNGYYDEVISSKSSNLFGPLDFSKWNKPIGDDYLTLPIDLKPNTNYRFSGSLVGTPITGGTVAIFNSNRYSTATKRYFKVTNNGNVLTNNTFNSENDNWYLAIYVGASGENEQLFNQIFQNYNIQLNEGTETLPYEPYWVNYEKVLSEKEFLNDYNNESVEYGKVIETGFKNSVNIIKETAEFLKDSIPSKDNILGPVGAIIKRVKELFPSFFMPNPIIK